jgi:isopentenyl-diphosphate Delta-isomerase
VKENEPELEELLMTDVERRKREHIDICLNENVRGTFISTGFEHYRFKHRAVPEIDFEQIRTETRFLGKRLKAPFLISSMTGGTGEAGSINRRLAELAESRGWAMGVGSLRAAVEQPELAATFEVRKYAPSIPLLANLGAVQLNYGFTAEHAMRAIEAVQADALVLHFNSLQEVFQPEGNTNFRALLAKVEELCRTLPVPVGAKEVGWGIDGESAYRLAEAGIAFIDVAGAGGTSWSQVEKHRSRDPIRRAAAEAFADWGNPTAECVREVRERLPDALLIASGGIATGVDAAKAIALGADLVGLGRALLRPATSAAGALDQLGEQAELELRAAMLGIGAATLDELKGTPSLVRVQEWR